MARTDTIVLGAGIVGTSIALQLAKRGLSVALIDRDAPGQGTSYGITGIIDVGAPFPPAFPRNFSTLIRVALKRAPEANYHLSSLPQIAPWLLAYRANSAPERRMEFAQLMRPLFSPALGEHEQLMEDAGATRYLRKEGRLNLYRSERAFAATAREPLMGHSGHSRPIGQVPRVQLPPGRPQERTCAQAAPRRRFAQGSVAGRGGSGGVRSGWFSAARRSAHPIAAATATAAS